MCQLGQESRAGFYRWLRREPPADPDLELRDARQRIALEYPAYGWPRMTRELQRRGWAVNHKRVYRLMREDNLLCLRRRKFVVTTDANQPLPVYPNLAREMVLTGVNQLWVADITYLRLEIEFSTWRCCWTRFSRPPRVVCGSQQSHAKKCTPGADLKVSATMQNLRAVTG
jgi:transposase InsO family protein